MTAAIATANIKHKKAQIHLRLFIPSISKEISISKLKPHDVLTAYKHSDFRVLKVMHVYMRDGNTIRFRCSSYPECRQYKKVPKEN
jgi:hypothetical protein